MPTTRAWIAFNRIEDGRLVFDFFVEAEVRATLEVVVDKFGEGALWTETVEDAPAGSGQVAVHAPISPGDYKVQLRLDDQKVATSSFTL